MEYLFKRIIVDFHSSTILRLGHRDLNLSKLNQSLRKALVFVGMRRSGKTWTLYQQMPALIQQGINIERILYINFADDRLFDL